MDLRQQLTILRHWAWLIIACVLLAGGAAYLVSSSLPKTYDGKVTLNVGQSLANNVSPDINQLNASQRLSTTYASVATTGPVMQRVISSLGLPFTPDELRSHINAQAPTNNTFVYVTASWGDPNTAANIANAVATELIAASPAIQGKQGDVQSVVDQQLKAMLAQIQSVQLEYDTLAAFQTRTPEQEQHLQSLQTSLIQLRSALASLLPFSSSSASNLVSVVDPALPPVEPSGPRVLLNTILAGILGFLIAVGLAFLVEHLDDTVKSPEDVAEVAGAPALGAIVRTKPEKGADYTLTTLKYPRAPASEAFRTLRTNLEFASVDSPLCTILVTSAIPSEGKTTVASNLAVVFAQAGKKVLLLDADLRRPGLHRAFDLPNSLGLTNLLRNEQQSIASVAHEIQDGLRVITTGALPPNPAELLGSHRMKSVLERIRGEADIVILDSPPLQVVTDAAVLATEVDGTLLVIDAGRTRSGAVRQARESLDRVGAKVLGAVINRLSDRAGAYYYYAYYSGYYSAGSNPSQSGSPGTGTASVR